MMGLPKRAGYTVMGLILLMGVALLLSLLVANESFQLNKSLQLFVSESSNAYKSTLLIWRLACYAVLLFVWPHWIKRLSGRTKKQSFQYRVIPLGLIVAYECMIVFNPLQWVMNKVMGGA